MNKQQKFYNKMIKGLEKLGASKDSSLFGYPYRLSTKYGDLFIAVEGNHPEHEHYTSELYTCFTRFDNVDEAKKHTSCNKFTGKWNFHAKIDDDIPEKIADSFIRHIGNII